MLLSEPVILTFNFERNYVHPERKWKMGLSKSDHIWLTETIGVRAKNQETWDKGLGEWRYLGSQNVTHKRDGEPIYRIRMMFRTKAQAILFKLARLGDI